MHPNACLSRWKIRSHYEYVMCTLCMSVLLSLRLYELDRLKMMLVCVWPRVTVYSQPHVQSVHAHVKLSGI